MEHDELCPMGKPMVEAITLQGRHVDPYNWVCVCARLRERYLTGLDSARDAVAALPGVPGIMVKREDVLAAIDGLRP